MFPDPGQLVRVAVGVWYCDESGIIPGSGRTILVSKQEAGAYGVLLLHKPRTRDEWIKEVSRQQIQARTQARNL